MATKIRGAYERVGLRAYTWLKRFGLKVFGMVDTRISFYKGCYEALRVLSALCGTGISAQRGSGSVSCRVVGEGRPLGLKWSLKASQCHSCCDTKAQAGGRDDSGGVMLCVTGGWQ